MVVNPEYLNTFRRIWESIRKELKERDVRQIRSRRQALQKLEGEKDRLIASLNRMESRDFFDTLDDRAKNKDKESRINQLEGIITGKKFAQRDFDEFIRYREEYGEE